MSDTKDLTSISDLSKSLASDPQAEEASMAGMRDPAQPIEKIEEFEPIESSLAPPAPSAEGTYEQQVTPSTPSDNSAILVAPPELDPGLQTDRETIPGAILDDVRAFSEQEAMPRTFVPAAFPFSLLIEGELDRDEKDKLLEILAREKMGISEVDLEVALQGDRILIPRISEYAGVLLVQALRATHAKMKLGPAEQIFLAEDSTSSFLAPSIPSAQIGISGDNTHHADSLPITAAAALPEIPSYSVIGVISVSASLKTTIVEAEHSTEYQEALEALQRELRYKAYHKHAVAILNFSTELTTLQLPSQYRLTVTGTAVRV